ncbi:MAG: preprotein translocase subunit SecE [Candidatus Pacebacteria bacterium]|nr:preprotein translocase subunit SecE [Candidatus Paceibacterota bacterium]
MKTQNQIKDFFGEVFAEMKRITWPTRKEALNFTFTVIVFILLASTFLGASDVIIRELLKKIVFNQ